jgi:hypothetical protein
MMPEEQPVLDVNVEDYMWKEDSDAQADHWIVDETVVS